MALSNWATLAWDKNGEPCDCRLEAEGDIDSHKQSIQDKKKAGIKYEDYQGSFQLFPADGR